MYSKLKRKYFLSWYITIIFLSLRYCATCTWQGHSCMESYLFVLNFRHSKDTLSSLDTAINVCALRPSLPVFDTYIIKLVDSDNNLCYSQWPHQKCMLSGLSSSFKSRLKFTSARANYQYSYICLKITLSWLVWLKCLSVTHGNYHSRQPCISHTILYTKLYDTTSHNIKAMVPGLKWIISNTSVFSVLLKKEIQHCNIFLSI